MEDPFPPRPRFIGFTTTRYADAQSIIATIDEHTLPEDIALGVGLRLTSQLLRKGRTDHATKPYDRCFCPPNQEEARAIAKVTSRLSPLILELEPETREPETLLREAETAFAFLRQPPDLLRFDAPWPAADAYETLHKRYPQLRFVLWLGPLAQALCSEEPAGCIDHAENRYGELLGHHGGPISHLLWNENGKRYARELNPEKAIRFVQTTHQDCPGVGPMLAGGFGPESGTVLDLLTDRARRFSVEARKRLAKRSGEPPDPERTVTYIREALKRLAHP